MIRTMMFAAAGAFTLLAGAAGAQVTTISNMPNGNSDPFGAGPGAVQTIGQQFTAPITGVLTSFSFSLNGGVGELFAGVGAYDYSTDSSVSLYTSGNMASTAAGVYTFMPNIAVTAGENYIAYLSVSGTSANMATTVNFGTSAPDIYYMVFNFGDPTAYNASWGYPFPLRSALFSASFSGAGAVPEPATWALMILGFGAVGAAMRRRQRVTARVRFA